MNEENRTFRATVLWTVIGLSTFGYFWFQERAARARRERFAQALKEPWVAEPKYLEPMMGGARSEEEKKSDQRFVDLAVKGSGSKDLAAVQLTQMGWEAYRSQNFKLALSRFNQAWLVDPDNGEAYWAFGLMNGLEDRPKETIDLLKKAAELLPESPKKARLYSDIGYAHSVLGDPVEPAAAREKIYKQAEDYYRKAESADPALALAQSQWAMLQFKREKFGDAWEHAAKARKLGGEGLDPEFVKVLEAQTGKKLGSAKPSEKK